MKKIIIALILITCALVTNAQQDGRKTSGIGFEQTLSWKQVLAKAKSEHKFIFVDCYATWCGPCKVMDADVYLKKSVGDIYNKDFISVKLQMDQTRDDNEMIKSYYPVVKWMESTFAVNAYPTFLFFDPEGKIAHKVVGAKNVKDFIELATVVRDPQKQYYNIVRDFKPNTLDTTEEKSLAYLFKAQDQELAGKIAADYLNRIPESQLAQADKGRLIALFQDNQQVLDKALNFIQADVHDDIDPTIIPFISALKKQSRIKEWAEEYIRKAPLTDSNNRELAMIFQKDTDVQQVSHKYIDGLNEEQLYNKPILEFVAAFTNSSNDRGFNIFYHHAREVNKVMKNNYFADDQIIRVISAEEYEPVFKINKLTGAEPDWPSLARVIMQKYASDYAEKVITTDKLGWYIYLTQEKKDERYWPEYVTARIAKVEKFRYDTVASQAYTINATAYGHIFLHGENKSQLLKVAGWMKEILDRNPAKYKYEFDDTYACLLYKAGKIREAIEEETKNLLFVTQNKNKDGIQHCTMTIDKMKKGEAIWLQKEFIDS